MVSPKDVFARWFDTEQLHRTRKTFAIHWFASSWKTEEERRELEASGRGFTLKGVRRPVCVLTKLLGEDLSISRKALFLKR